MLMRLSIAGAVIALAGCAGGLKLPSLPPLATAPGTPTLSLLDGAFTAAGPDGYCVDPNGSRPKKGFALLAPCAVLGVVDAEPRVHALTTVQVGGSGSAIVSEDPAAFAAYLESADGPVVLSRIGDPDTIRIREVARRADHVTVSLIDEAPAAIDGAQETEWRAFVDIAGRLVTIAVRGLDEAPLSDAVGMALLEQSIAAVKLANARVAATKS